MQRQTPWYRALAAGLIAVLLALSVLPLAAHPQLFDDPACNPHLPDDPYRPLTWRTGGTAEADQHCDVCHWLRSIRVFDPQPAFTPAPPTGASVGGTERVGSSAAERRVTLAARAPPA